jgi:hypothetical protein
MAMPCRLRSRLVTFAVLGSVSTLAAPARADGLLPDCAAGYRQTSASRTSVGCRREETVASPLEAERLSRQWQNVLTCNGHIEGLQSSVSHVDASAWLVVVRYRCVAR